MDLRRVERDGRSFKLFIDVVIEGMLIWCLKCLSHRGWQITVGV